MVNNSKTMNNEESLNNESIIPLNSSKQKNTSKQILGQFYTTHHEYILQNMKIPDYIIKPWTCTCILENSITGTFIFI